MPTMLPTQAIPGRRLPWPDTARLLVLVARVRFLDLRAHALVRRGSSFSDDGFLCLMRQWLRLYDAIAAILPGLPEPEHVRHVRAILLMSAKRVLRDA